jgi:hypothetical protein
MLSAFMEASYLIDAKEKTLRYRQGIEFVSRSQLVDFQGDRILQQLVAKLV